MKKIILLLFYFLSNYCLNAALDTIPVLKKNDRIQHNLICIHKGSALASKYLSAYSINDFTENQLDSFLLAFNSDNLVNPYLILSTGLWYLDREDVHQRMCHFISLDTLDYGGGWGENRRPRFDKNEWAARLALARLGYHYHIDFIESIFKELDMSGNNIAYKLSVYTHYINKNQITHRLLELALKDYYYSYFDWDNFYLGADTVTYYLSAAIMATSGLPIDVAEEKSYPIKWRRDITAEDIAQFKQWIRASRGEKITLINDSSLIDNGDFLSAGILIRPNAHLRELALSKSTQQKKHGSKKRPHINYLGACYFEGDTIYVDRDSIDRIWLMAWQDDQHIMDGKVKWKGVSATQKKTYARIDKKMIRRRPRRVRAWCSGCGEDGKDVGVSVFVVGR